MVLLSLLASFLCSLFGIFCSTPTPTSQPSLRPTTAPIATPTSSPVGGGGGTPISLVFSSQVTVFPGPCLCGASLLFRTGDLSIPLTVTTQTTFPELDFSPSLPIVFAAGQSSVLITICSIDRVGGTGFCGDTARSWFIRFEGPGGTPQSNTLEFEIPDFTTFTCRQC